MGIPFTCNQYNTGCTSIASLNSPSAVTTACLPANSATLATSLEQGWTYTLNAAAGSYLNERLITDPTVSTGANSMYFTTSEPTSDPCGYGGQSRVWGLNCATGEAIAQSCGAYTVTNLTGNMYLQTSTGAIYQIDAASSFTDTTTGNRTTPWFVGMPPENSPPVVQPATSTAKGGQLIQWTEK
jgi:type IV pilus assembly protein PilY1